MALLVNFLKEVDRRVVNVYFISKIIKNDLSVTDNNAQMGAGNTPPPSERHLHPHQLPLPMPGQHLHQMAQHGPGNTLMLSDLPEPPIPVSEIGPIPPPPMFSSPSPTMLRQQQVASIMVGHGSVGPVDMGDYDYEGKQIYFYIADRTFIFFDYIFYYYEIFRTYFLFEALYYNSYSYNIK